MQTGVKRSKKMKRPASSMDEYATAIVKEALTRDANQNLVYGELFQDPMTASFIAAKDPLLVMLRYKPILFLRLLQTNKALNKLWLEFPGIWRVMTQQLVEMELGGYMAEVYPFFVAENERFRAHSVFLSNNVDFAGRDKYAVSRNGHLIVRPELGIGLGLFVELPIFTGDLTNEHYYYVPYDNYTRLVITVLQYLLQYSSERGHRAKVREMLVKYLGVKESLDFLVCYLDGFLVTREFINDAGDAAIFTHPTDMASFLETLRQIVEKYRLDVSYDLGKMIVRVFEGMQLRGIIFDSNVKPNPLGDLNSLDKLSVATKPPKAIKLDATTMKDFSGKVSLLYANAPQGEKTLFLRLLGSFVRDTSSNSSLDDKSKITKYESGGYPLRCIVCETLTSQVDPHLELAFCRVECRTLYRK